MPSRNYYLLLLLPVLLYACTQRQPAEHSFYFWKNNANPYYGSRYDDSLVDAMGIQHFYVRFMDVDWSEQLNMPVPASVPDLDFRVSIPAVRHFTPVIFITGRTVEQMDTAWCDSLLALKLQKNIEALKKQMDQQYIDHVYYKIAATIPGYSYNTANDTLRSKITDSLTHPLAEIQIDCDWTARSKEKYFRFLRSMKRIFPRQSLSATIRLYPYKYPDKMGVPPVDRGMLMCYNMGNINRLQTDNSVFSLEELKQYIGKGNKYKLPLDIALPVFGWYAWFRGEKLKGILYRAELPDNALKKFFTAVAPHRYQLQEDYTIGDRLLREGDLLREEFPDPAALEAAAQLLKDHFPDARRITFFHWNPGSETQYETSVKKIYALF